MGCVFGKVARSDGRSRRHRSRSIEQPSAAVTTDGVVARDRKEAVERQRVNHTGDFPVIERRKPFQVNEQGWPSWLLAVAGDAIQGWTPRRANTFEKLSKVLRRFKDLKFFC